MGAGGGAGEGPTSGGLRAAGSRTGWERFCPGASRRSQPCPHLGFSPVRPGGASDLQNCKIINTFVLFQATALVVTCSSSPRKPPRCFVSLHFPPAKRPALPSCQQGAVVRGDEWTDVHGEVSSGPWGQQLPSRGLRGCRPVQLGSGAGRAAGGRWLSLPDEFGVLGVEVLQASRSRKEGWETGRASWPGRGLEWGGEGRAGMEGPGRPGQGGWKTLRGRDSVSEAVGPLAGALARAASLRSDPGG